MDKSVKLSEEILYMDGTPLVRLYGEIDLYTAQEFYMALHDQIKQDTTALIADLREISYLDSAGLRVLLSAHRALEALSGELYVIADPKSPGVHRVLEVTHFDSIFHVESTVEDALAKIRRRKAA